MPEQIGQSFRLETAKSAQIIISYFDHFQVFVRGKNTVNRLILEHSDAAGFCDFENLDETVVLKAAYAPYPFLLLLYICLFDFSSSVFYDCLVSKT